MCSGSVGFASSIKPGAARTYQAVYQHHSPAENVATKVMLKLRDLLDREVESHGHEWMETMQKLRITGRSEKRPVALQSRDVELDCRSIVNQSVSSISKVVLLRTSYMECQQKVATQPLKRSVLN